MCSWNTETPNGIVEREEGGERERGERVAERRKESEREEKGRERETATEERKEERAADTTEHLSVYICSIESCSFSQ